MGRERKIKWPKWLVTKINQHLYNKGTSVWGGGLALYLVLWLAVCPAPHPCPNLPPPDSSFLKWLPQQSKFKSSTCIMKRKKTQTTVSVYSPF